MLWDCKFCGKQKLLGLTHRHCPSCGAPQNAADRYFPSDADRVLAADHEYAGADILCAKCGQANGRKAKHCGGCGAPLDDGKDVALRTEQASGTPPVAPVAAVPVQRSNTGRVVVAIGCATALLLIAICLAALWPPDRRRIAELAQLVRKSGLDALGICRRELVFEGKDTMRPGGKSILLT